MLVCEKREFFLSSVNANFREFFTCNYQLKSLAYLDFFLLTLYTQLTRQLRQPRQPKVNKKNDLVVVNNNTHTINHIYEVHNKESSCHGLQPQPQLQWCYAHTEQMDRQMRCAEDTTLSARLHKRITKPHPRAGEPHLRVSWRAVIIERI